MTSRVRVSINVNNSVFCNVTPCCMAHVSEMPAVFTLHMPGRAAETI
jgi:hypothetical protein